MSLGILHRPTLAQVENTLAEFTTFGFGVFWPKRYRVTLLQGTREWDSADTRWQLTVAGCGFRADLKFSLAVHETLDDFLSKIVRGICDKTELFDAQLAMTVEGWSILFHADRWVDL